MNKKELLEIAIKASVEAGKAIMSIYNKKRSINRKEDSSPITDADLLSNEIILKQLLITGIPVLSEEEKEVSFNERKKWKFCWIIDPIDGTKEFIKKNGEFTVNIALVESGSLILGVIYTPATQELFYTNEFKSLAYKTLLSKDCDELDNVLFKNKDIISPRLNNKNSVKVVASRSHLNEDTLSFINGLKTEFDNIELVSVGSSLKFCKVAEGIADIYPRFAPTMEWDTAAGQAICEAVGLKVIDKITGSSILYNRENLVNNYFLVSK